MQPRNAQRPATSLHADGDNTMILADGRCLCWQNFGEAGGYPVLALHGTPGSRLKFELAHGAAERAGLRLISPDRWGYGRSDAPARPDLSTFADDMAALLDENGVERCAVVGISGGGPFATAVAARLADRISALALVAPVGPLAEPGDLDGVSLFHRFAFRVLPHVPGGIATAFGVLGLALRAGPAVAIGLMAARAGRADWSVMADRDVRDHLARTFRAGLAPGVGGTVIDMRLFARPWTISPALVRASTCLWLGSEDRNVPRAAALRLACAIGDAEVRHLPGAGHFWVTAHFQEVLEWLARTITVREGVRDGQ
ncbi:MAG: alpha/beta fold hydrolase [Hyphomicrobiaceae bacterium]|nr:alpha/beta fold hydrolase [Hyphomicrobiaceae bacterium]